MGCTYTSKKGNKMTMQDNGIIAIKPKQSSTLFYSVDDIVDSLEYLREQGFYQHIEDQK